MSDRLVPLGEIVATHGLEGWLKLEPFNPASTALEAPREVFVERDDTRSAQQLEGNRPHNRQILVKLHGIDSIEAAKPLVGANLCVTEDSLPALKPGEYYHYQAVGLEVSDKDGNYIGKVLRIWIVSGKEIYVVASATKEHLIPAVKDIVEKIDFDAGTMVINPPEGLLDL